MRSLYVTRALVAALVLCSGVAFGQQKKITVQGVVRRAGASGTDALINSSGQPISLTLKCEPAGSCGGSERTYTTSSGLDSGDSTITVRNGAFSVSLSPSAGTLAEMAQYKSANWWVLIDGQLDPLSPSTEFAIRLESVPFAYVADLATLAQNAEKLQGVTVDIPLGAATPDGKILKFQGGKLTIQDDTGGGGGGGTYTAGAGINIDGSNVVSVTSAIPQMTAGKISAANLNLGTGANQIPQLDGSGKLNSSVMPSDVATLSAGKIPSSMIDATSIPNDTINSSHISDGSIGTADIALAGVSSQNLSIDAVGNAHIQDGAVSDDKISDVAASKITGTLSAAQMPANLDLNGVTAASIHADEVVLDNQGELRLSEGAGGGTNYIALKAPATLAGNLTWTLPNVSGANDQILKFNATTNAFYWANDGGGSGSVSGPGSTTQDALARWDSTTGAVLADSSVTLDGSGNFSGINGLNNVSAAELDYVNGVTSGIQAQIDSAFSAMSGLASSSSVNTALSGKISKAADTMTGKFGLDYAGATPDRAAYLNANRELVTSANVSSAELEYLDGVTSGLQAQIDAAFSAMSGLASSSSVNTALSGKLSKAADTMTGKLGLVYSGVTPNRAAYVNANSELVTSANVDSTELDYLNGVTSNLGDKVNLFTNAEAGRLAGVTSSIQSQIDAAFSAIASAPSATGRIARIGDTMTGALGFDYSGVTPNRVAYIDANRGLVTSANVDSTELDYLNGVTSGIQAQIDAAYTAMSSLASSSSVSSGLSAKLDKAADTMTGKLGLVYSGVTPNRAAYVNANSELVTSANVDSTELDYLNGVTSNLGDKVNLFTNAEAGRLAGVTSAIQTQIDSAFSAISSIPTATTRVSRSGDTMTGALGFDYSGVTPNRVAYIDANRGLVTSANVDSTELDYLNGVTSGIQSQIDAAYTAMSSLASSSSVSSGLSAKLDKAADTMTGKLGLVYSGVTPNRAAYVNANSELVTSANVDSTELDYLNGVTSNLGDKVNLFTNAEAGRLAGVTSAIQTQIDAAFSAISSIPSATNRIARIGDTMTGALGFDYSGVTPNRVAYIDANRGLVTSSTVDSTELDYLNGATANIQAQIDAKMSSVSNDSITAAMLKNDVAASEAVTFDVLRTTDGNGESHANNTNRVVADRVYGTGSTEGTDKITLPAIVRIPLSVAHTDCGVVDDAGGDMVVCAGF